MMKHDEALSVNTLLEAIGIKDCRACAEPSKPSAAAVQHAAELLAERAFRVLHGGLHRGDVAHFYRVHRPGQAP